jgi:hypothetical protein
MAHQYWPIIYLRGYAMTRAEIMPPQRTGTSKNRRGRKIHPAAPPDAAPAKKHSQGDKS